MDKKAQIHDHIMSFLDNYLKETPKEAIKKEIAQISRLKFTGFSAQDYFLNFHKYYLPAENLIHNNIFIGSHKPAFLPQNIKPITQKTSLKPSDVFYFDKLEGLQVTLENKEFNDFQVTQNSLYNIRKRKYGYV